MKYNIGQAIHGFIVERSRHIKELGGDLYILRHEHSGAMLCYVDNDDRNMTYSVTFATPSHDSTGVFHILEHSVLCGSRKYPVDDPFVELMKSSLYTFLNAMTFPDKTMYPVSSMNEKDLDNLMSVYTDAVFNPLIYDNEIAFRQEGWHIEKDENGRLYYQGVVYNEMKGALGDPDETLYTSVFKETFAPCQYTTVSGGHPDHIVKLTYEDFIAAHKKYYHPSNARFYLYGKMDVESKLKFLDREYLSKVEAQEPIAEPEISLRRQSAPYVCTYTADSEKQGEDYIAFTYPVCRMPGLERYLALSVLTDILADTNYDPLKKRILDKGLAVELDCEMIEDIAYPLFTVKLRHCDADRLSEIDSEITACLRECAAGLDPEAVKAKLSTAEFNLREGSASGLTKGLYYNIQIMDAWLYDSDPWLYLEYEEALKGIKDGLDDGYFEKLIKDVLLDNPNRTVVVMKPTVSENKYSEPTSEPDGYEAEKPQPEADPIPHLSIGDVDKKAVSYATELKTHNGAPYLYHPLKTEGIVYTDLFFDLAQATDDELFYLSLLSGLLTNIPTAHTDGQSLQTKLGLYTGAMGMQGTVSSYKGKTISAATMRVKALAENYPKAMELMTEILTQSVFDDQKVITDLIGQLYTDMQLGLINNSSQIAAVRAAADHHVRDAILDKTGGISFYARLKALKEALDSSDDAFAQLKAGLQAVYDKFIRHGRAVLSVACDEESYEKIKEQPLPMADALTDRLEGASSPLLCGNIALTAPCDIVFNGYSRDTDDALSGGVFLLAKKILSLEYLWQKIRVENGAYGCGTIPNSAARLDMWSYRDPQIKSTLGTYEAAADFLSSLELSDRAVEDYIISVVRGLDNPQLPRAEAYLGSVYYLTGRGGSAIQQERDELLDASLVDINALGEKMKADSHTAAYCTVGSKENIEANKEMYDEIVKL